MSQDSDLPPPLTPARLSWRKHRTPASDQFNDVYYTVDSGLAETRHVFLDGTQLEQRISQGGQIVIAETGFGTGLNFLATWELWQRCAPPGARLFYLSVEAHPLGADDLYESLKPWTDLAPLAADLLRAYPLPSSGMHRVALDDPSVCLQLLYGDAAAMLQQLDADVDVWFLDGFAPDRNPGMWSEAVLAEVARLSKPGARLATYTAAGHVRRGLEAVGFSVTKQPGYGSKRDMTTAVYEGEAVIGGRTDPWYRRASRIPHSAREAAIIGGGIAGAAVAHALHRRGLDVTLVEQGPGLGAGASGNPMAVVMPRVTADASLAGRVMAESYRMALQAYEQLADQGIPITRDRRGAVLLAGDDQEHRRLKAAAANGLWPYGSAQIVTPAEVTQLAGVQVGQGGLFFPNAGWVAPHEVLSALTRGCRIQGSTHVAALDHHGGRWHVKTEGGETVLEADFIVAAGANMLLGLPPFHWLPLEPKRGQVTLAPTTTASTGLSTVLAGKGYVTPSHVGRHCLGATYALVDQDGWQKTPGVTEADHRANLEMISKIGADVSLGDDVELLEGRAALRATTPDRLPIAGPLPNREAYLTAYRGLNDGHRWTHYEDPAYEPGLYVLTGLGARGFVTAFLGAEIIAAQICGEPLPVEKDLIAALHPGRFLIRDLKRLKV